ncbi:MAG: ABC transporter substrate-binding protein [Clostridia bacterium]|nr:ABC transporter substrate-binding protein [Clostridia bacterium]
MNKALKLAGAVLLTLTIVSGCGQQAQNTIDENPTPMVDSNTGKVVREDQGPAQGGFLNLFMTTPDTLNPLTTKNPYVRQLSTFVFDPLFKENLDGSMKADLADSFTFSQDSSILDIKLKDGILFHDGEPLTADDVVFSVESVKRAGDKSLYRDHVSNIQSVKAVSRLDIRIVMNAPDMRLTEKLTFPILPQHVFKDWPIEGQPADRKLVGTGSFKFDSYKDNTIKLVRNDNWWFVSKADGLNHPVWLDGIHFRVYKDDSEMMVAFQKQEVDIAFLEDGDLQSYSKRADIFFSQYENNTLEFIALSSQGETGSPISQEAFRTILLKYICGYAAKTPLGSGNPAYESTPEYGAEISRLSREDTIKALLDQGFTYLEDKNTLYMNKNGSKVPITLTLKFNGINSDRQKEAEWLTIALEDIGIQLIPQNVSYADEKNVITTLKYDMMLLGCRMPLFTDMTGTLELLKTSMGTNGQNAVILPFFRKNGAVLYNNRIRGPRMPVWKNIYNGWEEWYLVQAPK